MLRIDVFTLGDLDTNTYLVWCSQTLEAVIIDPAASGDFLTQELLSRQLKLQALLLTHGHFDHCLGALELKLNFSVPLLVHEADLFLLSRAQESAEYWLKHPVDPVPPADGTIDKTSSVVLGKDRLSVLETPGHTPGSVCFFSAGTQESNPEQFVFSDQPTLFSGDTLFKGESGSVRHRYSKVLQLRESLRSLSQLPAATVVLPGHGAETSIGSEQHLL